jgi:hypothetical protein
MTDRRTTMHYDDTRRHPDGSIDFDFYRRRSARLRRRAMRDFVERQRLLVGWPSLFRNALLGAAVLAAIALAIGYPVGKNTPDASLAGENSGPSGRS